MPGLKTLAEYAIRAIANSVNSIDSLGNLPYRLAKPILLLMTPEKILEIERISPHIKDEDQGESLLEVWQSVCVKRFALRLDAEDFEPPKSWRKFYHNETARLQKLEDDAGERMRKRYKAADAEKQERTLIFKAEPSPMKRRGVKPFWTRGPAAPKTLADKARIKTRKIQLMTSVPNPRPFTPASSSASSPASTTSSVSTSPFLTQPSIRPVTVTTTMKPAKSSPSKSPTSMSPPPMKTPGQIIGVKRPLPQSSPPTSASRLLASSPPWTEMPLPPKSIASVVSPPTMTATSLAPRPPAPLRKKKPRNPTDVLFMPPQFTARPMASRAR
ncbi:hypothetical protein DL93DRAFT_2164617 [Clavulina sp. PMI_390]|nr:hypothetical protein DL93DRAFT_2164617 [Clavulina sp. PMI_390]